MNTFYVISDRQNEKGTGREGVILEKQPEEPAKVQTEMIISETKGRSVRRSISGGLHRLHGWCLRNAETAGQNVNQKIS